MYEEFDMKKVIIHDNYYSTITLLPIKKRPIISYAILEYMFEGIEPNFKDKDLLKAWSSLIKPLNQSKTNSENISKRYDKSKATKDEKSKATKDDTELKNGKGVRTTSLFYLNILNNNIYFTKKELIRKKVENWINYKCEREEFYEEIAFKTLLEQIEKYCERSGEEEVMNLIDECISSNYKNIYFDRLKSIIQPTAFKSVEKEVATEEDQKELKDLLKDFS